MHLPSLEEGELALPGEVGHHLQRVLRRGEGDRFLAFDGQGAEALCELVAPGRARVLQVRHPAVEPSLEVSLYLGLTRGERFDLAVEKATELGVARLVPLRAERSVVGPPGSGRQERWRRLAASAAAQSGRVRLPRVEEPVEFGPALEQARRCRRALLLAPGGARLEGPFSDSAALLIGPEGGFSPAEVEQARAAGLEVVGLGPRILRVETAVAAALALVLYLAGEGGGQPAAPLQEDGEAAKNRAGWS